MISVPRRRSVSVIIPTVGRQELARAIRSVQAQEGGFDVNVIVVFDGPADLIPAAARAADVTLTTGGGAGGSAARNKGLLAATGDFVAFLDDDDEWLPTKLIAQIALLEHSSDPLHVVVSGRHIHVDASTGVESAPSPTRLIGTDESVEHYLFRRRPPHGGRPSMYTSTLLCSRTLALSERWDESLRRHQDWDWIIRLGRRPLVVFVQAAEPVARIQTGSAQSISASSDWRSSIDWASASLSASPSIHADFVAAQTLRYALQARDWQGVRAVFSALRRGHKVPSLPALIVGIGGLLPRQMIERITARSVRAAKH